MVAAILLVGATYFANVGTRFLIPILPFLSLAMLIGLPDSPRFLAAVAVAQSILCWPGISKNYASPYAWTLHRIPWKAALRLTPADQYLRENSDAYNLARLVEAKVPKGQKVLSIGGVADAYTTREVLVNFQSASNEVLYDALAAGWALDYQPILLRRFTFPPVKARAVRVVQTANTAADQWSLHEIRFYSGTEEIERKPDWKVTSSPNPWESGEAFDRSWATRWRSWERATPGMFIEARFPEPRELDAVHIDMSTDHREIRMEVQVQDESGTWRKVGGEPTTETQPIRGNLRRAATYELRTRGVNYVLIGDGDWGGDDMREDPESWGLKELGHGWGHRLYEVLP